ncbi:MAG: prepilin peptidase [Faecousia sp.]
MVTLNYLLGGAVFAAASVWIIYTMCAITNNKIEELSLKDNVEENAYRGTLWTCAIFACIVFLSGLCGILISQYAMSGIAIVKLGFCYFAILAAAIIDYKLRIIPNFIPLTLIGARVLIFLYEFFCMEGYVQELIFSLIGCLLCGLILVLGNKISKGGIGAGDIKLLCCVGLVCGVNTVFTTLLLALICCCILAVVGMMMKKITLKNSVPFGPFIYIGYVLMCLMTLY